MIDGALLLPLSERAAVVGVGPSSPASTSAQQTNPAHALPAPLLGAVRLVPMRYFERAGRVKHGDPKAALWQVRGSVPMSSNT